MKKLACADIDETLTCNFEASGETEEEVAEKLKDHFVSAHADKAKIMDMTEEEMQDEFAAQVEEEDK